MANYGAKRGQRKMDIFDSVINESEDSPPMVSEPVRNTSKGKENIRPNSSVTNLDKETKSPAFLCEDSYEKCNRHDTKKAGAGKAKTNKKPKEAKGKKEIHQKSPDFPDFSEFENDSFHIEMEKNEKPLHSITNCFYKTDSHSPKISPEERPTLFHQSSQDNLNDIIPCTPGIVTDLRKPMKQEDNFALRKASPFSNVILSQRKRLRPRKSIVKNRTSNNSILSPGSNLEDLTCETQSCSTPKTVNQNDSLGSAHSCSVWNTSAVTPNPKGENSNRTYSSFELNESAASPIHEVFDGTPRYSNSLYTEKSSCMNLSLADSLACDPKDAESKVLHLCNQRMPIAFTDCFSERMMSDCVKIGEGVYGEVFKSVSMGKQIALKIIPIEGDILVNDCPQKRFDEILPEIVIARELSDLTFGVHNRSSNFCQVNRVSCVKGAFPMPLLQQWDEYAKRKKSENDRPDFFTDEQLFIVFEFAHGGTALESFKFQSQREVFSVLRQIVFALAIAEKELEFEHRDLHIGNVLVKNCVDETITFYLDDSVFEFHTEGVIATIIDFTISRLKKDECAVFCDISNDEGLFEGSGDIQFDVYRKMRIRNGNNWENFHPESNILWTNYICSKLLTTNKVKNARRAERYLKQHLHRLDQEIQDYNSCVELASVLELWAE